MGVTRIAPAGRAFVRRLRDAGRAGAVPAAGVEHSLADLLVARGIAHPLVAGATAAAGEVDVIVPAYERPELLDICLASLSAATPARILVVDDASIDPAVSGWPVCGAPSSCGTRSIVAPPRPATPA